MGITTEALRSRRRKKPFWLSGDDDNQKILSLRRNNVTMCYSCNSRRDSFFYPIVVSRLDKKRYKLCVLCVSVVNVKSLIPSLLDFCGVGVADR